MSREHTPDNVKSFIDDISYNLDALHFLTQKQRMFDCEAEIIERKLQQLEDDVARFVKSFIFYKKSHEQSFLSRLKENQARLEAKNTHSEDDANSHPSQP